MTSNLLTTAESERAAQQGWQLCHVFDQDAARWMVEIIPTDNNTLRSARAMQATVLELARNRDAVALRAMSLVMASHAPPPKRKKK